jgi:hypothetical protein
VEQELLTLPVVFALLVAFVVMVTQVFWKG